MFKALTTLSKPRATLIIPQLIYVARVLNTQYLLLKEFYRTRALTVSSDHLIYKLLHSLPFRLEGTPENVVDSARASVRQIANVHKLVHQVSRGGFYSGNLFETGSQEVYIATDTPFNIEDAKLNWKDLEPIKFIRHPFCDTKMPVFTDSLPPAFYTSNRRHRLNDKVYVLEINLPMLVFQYYMWYLETTDIGSTMNIKNYICSYPLTNAVKSYTNVSYFNRLIATFDNKGKRIGSRVINPHPTLFADPVNDLDAALETTIINTVGQPKDASMILGDLRTPFDDNPLGLVDISYRQEGTRQNIWGLSLGLIPYISGILKLTYRNKNAIIKPFVRELHIDITRFYQSAYIKMAPSQLQNVLHNHIVKDIKKYYT